MVIGPFAYEGEEKPSLLRNLFPYFKKEKKMVVSEKYQVNPPYSIWKTVWKGLRPALWAAGAAAILVFAGFFSEASNLVAVGLPPLLAMMLAEIIRNTVKEYRRRK